MMLLPEGILFTRTSRTLHFLELHAVRKLLLRLPWYVSFFWKAVYWLTSVLRGHIELPSKEKQRADIDNRRKILKEICGEQDWGAGNVSGNSYLDQICHDLQISPLRKIQQWAKWGGIWNPLAWISEFVDLYLPEDYKFLDIESEIEEAIRKKSDRSKKPINQHKVEE
ncbi:hypothetical protein HK100_004903 [Physocladia obscura]|uniref:Uncharacterized protein n=1 Tax=Physocladia obscura TaxID=109957 RepID=A0AAD5XGL2_9FUNG|nr:hypothetical protein HK100_004903 [Physocladia obscura]